jgi:hypothetical protein
MELKTIVQTGWINHLIYLELLTQIPHLTPHGFCKWFCFIVWNNHQQRNQVSGVRKEFELVAKSIALAGEEKQSYSGFPSDYAYTPLSKFGKAAGISAEIDFL